MALEQVHTSWVTCKQPTTQGPGASSNAQGAATNPRAWAEEDTHLEHDLIDGSSVGFKVEVFIVVIA